MSAPITSDQVADIAKSDTEHLRITIEDNRRGRVRVKLREWFRSGDTLRPGRAGLELRLDVIDEVIVALQAARLKHRGEGAR